MSKQDRGLLRLHLYVLLTTVATAGFGVYIAVTVDHGVFRTMWAIAAVAATGASIMLVANRRTLVRAIARDPMPESRGGTVLARLEERLGAYPRLGSPQVIAAVFGLFAAGMLAISTVTAALIAVFLD